jgi:hypothetical protein
MHKYFIVFDRAIICAHSAGSSGGYPQLPELRLTFPATRAIQLACRRDMPLRVEYCCSHSSLPLTEAFRWEAQ